MLADRELRELLQFISPDPVLSVYLNTDPTQGNSDAYRLRLRNLLKGVNLPEDVDAVERYFQRQYDWTGKSVAVFSSQSQGFFRVYPLAIPIPDLVHVSDRPSVRVLADLLDSYGGYGVVIVDKQGARVFSFHLGELREQEGVLGDPVKHAKHGGAPATAGGRGGAAGRPRHQEEVVDRNMKDAMEFAVDFFESKRIRRILIGGTDDNVAQFRGFLPKAWQSLVVGTFPMSMTVGAVDVLEKAMQIGRAAELKREVEVIDQLFTQSGKGSGAVIGLTDTLTASNEDRISTLVVLQGYQQTGYRCSSCRHLAEEEATTCPNCGDEMRSIPDLVDVVVGRTMRQGGDVEVVHENPQLELSGKIGAFLRY